MEHLTFWTMSRKNISHSGSCVCVGGQDSKFSLLSGLFSLQCHYIIRIKQYLGQSLCWGAHCIGMSANRVKDIGVMDITFSNCFHGHGCENCPLEAWYGWKKRAFFPFWIKNLAGHSSNFHMLGTQLAYKWVGFSLEKTWDICTA